MVGRFPGGVVSAKGDIYARDGDSCIAAQNGACFFHEPFKRGAEAVIDVSGMRWIDGVVVTIAVSQAETATYHVVAEQLAAIALVQDAINTAGGVFYLHLTARNAFIDQWIAILIPGLPETRILTGGSVAARLLLVPQQTCGKPTPSQMLWMRARVMAALGPKTATLPVLITRTKSRPMPGWAAFSAGLGPHVDHADGSLPPVLDQLRYFHTGLVVAPHGAGLVNMLAAPDGVQ